MKEQICLACSNAVKNCLYCSDAAGKITCDTCMNDLVIFKEECASCSSAISNCDKCTQDKTSKAITCTSCGSGKDLKDNTCQDPESSNSDTIIIISSVVGGVVLIGAGIAVFRCMKKRKDSILTEEGYDKI